MTILSKEEVTKIREELEVWMPVARKDSTDYEEGLDLLNALDTIADRDKQIQDLRAKVGELEEAAKPFEHKFGCDRFLCTCVAVKEPEAVMDITTTKAKDSDHYLICQYLRGGVCNCGI